MYSCMSDNHPTPRKSDMRYNYRLTCTYTQICHTYTHACMQPSSICIYSKYIERAQACIHSPKLMCMHSCIMYMYTHTHTHVQSYESTTSIYFLMAGSQSKIERMKRTYTLYTRTHIHTRVHINMHTHLHVHAWFPKKQTADTKNEHSKI